jgi:protein SCO1
MRYLLSLLLPCALLAAEPLPPCCRAPLPAGQPTDKSLYLLESRWTSDVGKEIKLGVLRGRPQVVAMFFTRCEYACPIVVGELKAIEQQLPPGVLEKVDFLLVSMDSKHDTAADLAKFRDQRHLARERWTLLRGETDDVRELAALLGVNYAEDTRGQFAHSNIITVLNAEGEIAFQHLGVKQDPAALIAAIEKAALDAKR